MSDERITIDELESYLWGAAVLLRTNVDAGAYKQYIFPLLFFKQRKTGRRGHFYDSPLIVKFAVRSLNRS